MNKFLTATTGLICLALIVPGAAFAQRTLTGDRILDSLLTRITLQERSDPDGFILHLSRSYGVPEADILQARLRYGLNAGDTYMSTFLSRVFNTSVGGVAEEYTNNQGRGWGVMALNRGIKPGSPEFHQMKTNAQDSLDNMKSIAKAKNNRKILELKKERENDLKLKEQAQDRGRGKGKIK